MIKYSLNCKDCNLTFESWFASSKEYEKLKRKKFLNCHSCNSVNIEKSLMAPNLINKKLKVSASKELNLLEIILPIKQDQFIIVVKKKKKVFMGQHQKKI